MKLRFLMLLFVSGCATAQLAPPAKTLVYRCNKSYQFTARENGNSLQLLLPSGERQLTREASKIGRLYKNGDLEFWDRGDQAELKMPGQLTRQCPRDRGMEVWEDARFRGVELRAAGTRPGWFVELKNAQLVYAGDYGQQRLVFDGVRELHDDKLVQTTLDGTLEGHKIKLLLQQGDCWEGASQQMFDLRVTLDLDGKITYGCGKNLQ